MPTNPPRHSPVFPVVIIIFSVDWVSLEDALARILPGGMHDISLLRSLLFSWSDSPREEPTIHQMEETHGPPMKEVDGALVVRPQLLLKPSVFGLLPSPSVQLGSLVQWLSYLFRRRNFYLLLAGGGAVTWLLSAKRIWGGSRGFSHSSSSLCLASHRSLTGDTPTEKYANCHPVPRRQWRSLTCFRNAHLRFGVLPQQLIKYLQRAYFYDQHKLQCCFTRNRPFLWEVQSLHLFKGILLLLSPLYKLRTWSLERSSPVT